MLGNGNLRGRRLRQSRITPLLVLESLTASSLGPTLRNMFRTVAVGTSVMVLLSNVPYPLTLWTVRWHLPNGETVHSFYLTFCLSCRSPTIVLWEVPRITFRERQGRKHRLKCPLLQVLS